MPYPMANGEVRRMKRREAILDVDDLYEAEKKDVPIYSFVPTTVFQVLFL